MDLKAIINNKKLMRLLLSGTVGIFIMAGVGTTLLYGDNVPVRDMYLYALSGLMLIGMILLNEFTTGGAKPKKDKEQGETGLI